MVDGDINEIGLQFLTLCSKDDFTNKNGLDFFHFIFGALWSWKLNKNIRKVGRILVRIKKDNVKEFESTNFGDIKSKAKLICGRDTLQRFVNIVLKLRKPNSSIEEHSLRRNVHQSARNPNFKQSYDIPYLEDSKSDIDLDNFWKRWFSLFQSAKIYRAFEAQVLEFHDSPSEEKAARLRSMRHSGMLSTFRIDRKGREYLHFQNLYAVTQKHFCYYRTMFIECGDGSAKMFSPGRSCPFVRLTEDKVPQLDEHYKTPGYSNINTRTDADIEEERRNKLRKEGEETYIKKQGKTRDDAIALIKDSEPFSRTTSSGFGAIRTNVLRHLRHRGVRYIRGSFVNRFGQTISVDRAYRHYST